MMNSVAASRHHGSLATLHASQAGLARIARTIADPARSLESLIGVTGELQAFVERHTQLVMESANPLTEGGSTLPSGRAISPLQAALCAREMLRSAAFIQGLASAIRARLNDAAPVAVLYAGCGPFALLALPLMAIFSPRQVQFTVLEVHEEALGHARTLIDELGYNAHVAAFVCTDAATWRIAPDAVPDVIVSETMNTALGKEPQVAIMRNLFAQAPQATLVPSAISVHVGAEGNTSAEPCSEWGKVFEINAQRILDWQSIDAPRLPAASITLPADLGYGARLLTRIEVYGEIRLGDYDSSLNLPLQLPGKPTLKGKETLAFSYQLGSAPGLACEVFPPQ